MVSAVIFGLGLLIAFLIGGVVIGSIVLFLTYFPNVKKLLSTARFVYNHWKMFKDDKKKKRGFPR